MKRFSLQDSDHAFVQEIESSDFIGRFRGCFTCGTCTAGCPVHRVNKDYDPRKIVRMLVLGFREELLKGDMIWLCSDCYTCQENCPMEVKITDIINHLKNLATCEKNVPLGVSTQGKLLKEQGKIYLIDEFDNKKRAKVGLPALPEMAEKAKKLLKQRLSGV
ncbi:MAG TPA: 4Fe-4S dicluster domain-containing protein [Desulfatiglandales bacterium]|nr:4Fe-4S dicluster domain-containing protein [Desulfatiglandales bacterium]